MKSENKIPITPETKISQLLEAYPELENTLIEIAPAFKKLKNPVLRKTIAKITSLQQAAKIGNIALAEIINKLRDAAGIGDLFEVAEQMTNRNVCKPDWLKYNNVIKTIDARLILERGEQPVNIIIKELKMLQPNQIIKLITAFLPEPLIDKAKQLGYQSWTKKNKDVFNTYFI